MLDVNVNAAAQRLFHVDPDGTLEVRGYYHLAPIKSVAGLPPAATKPTNASLG